MDLAKVNFNELKSACKSLNDSGMLKKKIKLIGLKKAKLVETFIAEVEKLDDQGLTDDVPEDAFNFYNSLDDDSDDDDSADETEEVEDDDDDDEDDSDEDDSDEDDSDEDDSDEDDSDEDDDDEEEDDDEDDDDEEDEEDEEIDLEDMNKKELLALIKEKGLKIAKAKKLKPAKLRKSITAALEALKEVDDDDDDDDEEEEETTTKKKKAKKGKVKKEKKEKKAKKEKKEKTSAPRERVATVKMSCKVDGERFRIKFDDGSKGKAFKMPAKKSDKAKLKTVIKKSVDFAKEKGATDGQVKAVRKAFTKAGWYMTK